MKQNNIYKNNKKKKKIYKYKNNGNYYRQNIKNV